MTRLTILAVILIYAAAMVVQYRRSKRVEWLALLGFPLAVLSLLRLGGFAP